MNPRKNRTRRRRLTQAAVGTAATSALFALPHSADAAVIYTNPTDIVVSGFVASFDIDINGGGNDFRGIAVNTGAPYWGSAGFWGLGPGNQFLVNGTNQVRKLASGSLISAGAPSGWLGDNARGLQAAGTYTRGTWGVGQTGFAGIRMAAGGGSFNYGWVRMRMDDIDPSPTDVAGQLTILDWAYETDVNTAITTPFTAAPEPSRALLALAGLGAAALRRRRKTA